MQDRRHKLGRGLTIIHKEAITCTTFTDEHAPFMEHKHFRLKSATPPSTKAPSPIDPGRGTNFSNLLTDFIAPIAISSNNFILLGNLNFHLTDPMGPHLHCPSRETQQHRTQPSSSKAWPITQDTTLTQSSQPATVTFSHLTPLTWKDHSIVPFHIYTLSPQYQGQPQHQTQMEQDNGCKLDSHPQIHPTWHQRRTAEQQKDLQQLGHRLQ